MGERLDALIRRLDDDDKAAEIKKLRHQIGVSEQNMRWARSNGRSGENHRQKALACKARLKELEGDGPS